ncbi:hypothetical protein C4097_06595 [Clostridioides difficile]|nr:hypothetical protein [Clostridioides difficile]
MNKERKIIQLGDITIKERDLECLKLLNEYGAVKRKYVHKFYELKNPKNKYSNKYKYARINRLKEEQYIEENKKMFTLGNEGRIYLKLIGEKIHYKNYLRMEKRRFLSDIHELLYSFRNFKKRLGRSQIQNGKYIKDGTGFIKLFYGKVISNNDKEYFVYKVKRNSNNFYIKKVINEINDLMVENVIIFFENENNLRYYKSIDTQKKFMKTEILMNLKEDSFKVLNLISDDVLNNENIFDLLKSNINIKFINNYLYINNIITFNFLENDFVKEELVNYFIQEQTIDSYYILCFEHQKDRIKNEFKNAKIVSLDINSIYK